MLNTLWETAILQWEARGREGYHNSGLGIGGVAQLTRAQEM
jgi:hypothetical protein